MHPRAEEFAAQARDRYEFDPAIREFPEGTKTAADAAEAIGCAVGQIASSLVFAVDDRFVVVVTSGANRVSEARVAAETGVAADDVRMADADRIREVVGWSIGGVPPFCHASDLAMLLDRDLTDYETVWAAGGTPTAVFPVTPDELVSLTGATVTEVAE
ncbi:YbaK/EbsC family protein [Salinirubrum litoreum]|uniref:YbaK/EbsC family protein n=1 Tax=Salinirubrum litoreum TaxID=1126234 RepID=A0ABD5R820_9EURY